MAVAKKSGRKYVVVLVVGVVLAIIGGAMFPVVDHIIKEEIKKKVVISNTSELYDIWQDVPVPIYMQFYMFNVLNIDEIKAGEKPYVLQQGPYTYRERRVKYDIVWNQNGTVTYRQNRTFEFVPEMSSGSEGDLITTINPLMAVIAQSLQWLPEFFKKMLAWVLDMVENEDVFLTRTVSELLWGYDDPALVMLNKILPSRFDMTNIGYFIRKNYTDDGLYTVDTGKQDVDRLGIITRYNGESHVNIWTTRWANMVNGTDGTLGPPFRFEEKVSPTFVSDLCRSIRGIYTKDVYLPQGIKLRRFGGSRFDMANATLNPDNIGFCTPQTKCLPTGLLNSTLCQEPVDGFPLPVIFSFPHFLYADPEVQDSVFGMEPNEKEHATLIDIEPWTGLVLQVAKRLQINMFVEKVSGIKQTYNLRKLYFPILWLNESSVTDDKHANMLKDQLFTPMEIASIGRIAILCLGGLLVLVSVGLLIRRRHILTRAKLNAKLAGADKEASAAVAPVGGSDNTVFYDDPVRSVNGLENSVSYDDDPVRSVNGLENSVSYDDPVRSVNGLENSVSYDDQLVKGLPEQREILYTAVRREGPLDTY